MSTQHEITQGSLLLNERGELTQIGWCRQPLLDCNLESAKPQGIPRLLWPWRIKKWDYYAFFTPTHFFSITLADIGYAGSVFAYVIDYATGRMVERTITIPFSQGIELARNSWEGVSRYEKDGLRAVFTAHPRQRDIELQWPDFEGQELNFKLRVATPPEHESMALTIPIEGRKFYWNRKAQCLPVEGTISWGKDKWTLSPATSLALLDWGRGIWAYKSRWVWASASGFSRSRDTIGLNFGCGFGDTARATENALILNGKVHKLKDVSIHFERENYMTPWVMRDKEGRLDVTFTPFKERVAKTNLGVLVTEVHQIFGYYDGWVKTDEGTVLPLQKLIGFAEEHFARW